MTIPRQPTWMMLFARGGVLKLESSEIGEKLCHKSPIRYLAGRDSQNSFSPRIVTVVVDSAIKKLDEIRSTPPQPIHTRETGDGRLRHETTKIALVKPDSAAQRAITQISFIVVPLKHLDARRLTKKLLKIRTRSEWVTRSSAQGEKGVFFPSILISRCIHVRICPMFMFCFARTC